MRPTSSIHHRGAVKLLFALALGVFLALVVSLIIFGREGTGMTFTVTFSDLKGLKVEAPVVLNDKEVGNVVSIAPAPDSEGRWRVELGITKDNQRQISSSVTARIIPAGLLQRQAEVRLLKGDDNGAPMRPGTVVQGIETWTEEQLIVGQESARRGIEQLGGSWESISSRIGLVMEGARDWLSSPDGRRLQGRMEEVRTDLRDFAVTKVGEAGEKVKGTMDKGQQLILELRDLGRDDLADELSRTLESLQEEFRETTAPQGEKPAPEGEPTE